MSLFKGNRITQRGGSTAGRGDNPHSFYSKLQPPRPNPAAKFAPKPNNPKTTAYGNQLGAGYAASKATYDIHAQRAASNPDPARRAEHLAKANREKIVMDSLHTNIVDNAKQGDIWRSRY